jgi:hypothetical protein
MGEQRVTVSDSTVNGTSSHIDALVDANGDLVLEGHDTGAAPLAVFGDSDYEWWVRVSAENRDAVLLNLLAERFGGAEATSSAFMQWLDEKGIAYKLDSYA